MANLIVQTNVLPLPAAWSGYAKRGGHLTYVLHWLHGLKRLGHRVVLLNPAYRDSPLDLDRKHFSEFMTDWWSIEDSILLAIEPEESLAGMPLDRWRRFTQTADAFLTLGISGIRAPESLAHVRPRILVDQDPGYTQLWAAQSSTLEEIFGLHDLYCTVGLSVGTEQCRLPTLGIKWHRVVNPVIADWWQHDAVPGGRLSTVADWWGQELPRIRREPPRPQTRGIPEVRSLAFLDRGRNRSGTRHSSWRCGHRQAAGERLDGALSGAH